MIRLTTGLSPVSVSFQAKKAKKNTNEYGLTPDPNWAQQNQKILRQEPDVQPTEADETAADFNDGKSDTLFKPGVQGKVC
jgi:hypothetical protein